MALEITELNEYVRYKASIQNQAYSQPLQSEYPRGSIFYELTQKKFQVICFLANGYNNSEIARVIGLKENSVSNLLGEIYVQLGFGSEFNNRVTLTLLFLRERNRNLAVNEVGDNSLENELNNRLNSIESRTVEVEKKLHRIKYLF